ncbi:MAG TPA: sigma-70 family RNA polymerase sigma factor [Anaerolineae bacterium]|nr:sigma-70 family RNA polymerase sigma factor [Anaerolineae bacterium]
MLNQRGDERLVARLREGDLSALGEVYDTYRVNIFQAALAITRDREASETILRDCFVALSARADSIDPESPLAPWLYRKVVELSYAWVTRHSKWWTSLEGLLDRFDRLVASAHGASALPVSLREAQEGIDRAIDALPFNQRIVVILYYLGGLSLKEIAHILDCPVGTAKSRLHYGREALRQHLDAQLQAPEWLFKHDLAPSPGA